MHNSLTFVSLQLDVSICLGHQLLYYGGVAVVGCIVKSSEAFNVLLVSQLLQGLPFFSFRPIPHYVHIQDMSKQDVKDPFVILISS